MARRTLTIVAATLAFGLLVTSYFLTGGAASTRDGAQHSAPLARDRHRATSPLSARRATRPDVGPAAAICGIVVSAKEGRPLARATVSGPSSAALVDVDDAGRWRLRGLDARGTTNVAITAPGYLPFRGSLQRAAGDCQAPPTVKLFAGGASVAIEVHDALGGPVVGAIVELRSHGAGAAPQIVQPPVRALTNADGLAHAVTEPGEIAIAVRAEGYADTTLQTIVAPQTEDHVLVVIEPATTLHGKVVDGEGVPRANIDVFVARHGPGSSVRGQPRAVTGPDGRFVADSLGTGEYVVRAAGDGYASRRAERVVMRLGLPTDVTLVVEHSARLVGRMTSEGGKPTVDAMLALSGATQHFVSAPTGRDGWYSLDVPPGKYFWSVVAAAGVLPAMEGPITLAGGNNRRDVVIASGGGVSGWISGCDDLSSVTVRTEVDLTRAAVSQLKAAAINGARAAVPQPDGSYRIGGLSAGTVTVIAESPGCGRAEARARVADDVQRLDLQLEPTSSMTLSVNDSSGAAVRGATVELKPLERPRTLVSIAVARHGIGGAAVTDDVGHATWHSLHPGRYAVRVQTMDGPVPASQMRGDVVIATRDGSPAAFALVIERAANTVAGIVRCSDHTPAADALVDVRTHGGVTHVATDERGRFEVTELPRGFRYRLTARHATCGVGSMIVTSSDPVLLVLDPDAPLVVEAPADGRAVLRGPTVVSSAVRRGSHRFEVKPGSYTIEYTTEQGYASAHIDVPPMGTTLELDLEPWSKATGQLRDATGAPLAGWIVLAGDRRQRARQLSRLLRGHGNVTSSDGSFQLRNLRQGTQALQFISPTGQGELNTSIDVHRQLVRLDPVYAPTGHLD